MIRCASFDIGQKNFCVYIEEFDPNELTNIHRPAIEYNTDGTCTAEMEDTLKKVFKNGKSILHINADITDGCKGKFNVRLFQNMTLFLRKHISEFDKCDFIIIEQQMKINLKATKLGQHCYSFFQITYSQKEQKEKKIVIFPSYHKTQVLGAQKGLNKKGKMTAMSKAKRKKWSVEKASEILNLRGEFARDALLQIQKKKDDLADTITQLQAFKYRHYCKRSAIQRFTL